MWTDNIWTLLTDCKSVNRLFLSSAQRMQLCRQIFWELSSQTHSYSLSHTLKTCRRIIFGFCSQVVNMWTDFIWTLLADCTVQCPWPDGLFLDSVPEIVNVCRGSILYSPLLYADGAQDKDDRSPRALSRTHTDPPKEEKNTGIKWPGSLRQKSATNTLFRCIRFYIISCTMFCKQ